jgi:DinB superfamily
MSTIPVRDLLGRALAWHDAHASFEDAVKDIPVHLRGKRPEGLPYSAWELLAHLRIAQRDILDFCADPNYKEDKKWPDDYWPPSPAPSSDAAWDESIREFIADRTAMQRLAADTGLDLEGKIPHGSGQTYLRELVLTIDHNAYHIGQLVLVRRLLGIWNT